MKIILILVVAVCVFTLQAFTQTSTLNNLHKKPMDFKWKPLIAEADFKHLKLPGKVEKWGVADPTGLGKLIRAIRFEPITRAVEARYGIPEHTVLAMVMQESGGGAAMLNSGNDGGAGLSHMQPSVGAQFGLRIYDNNIRLVDRSHGAMLRALYTQAKLSWMTMSDYDDRFHPIANLDAVGRMLCHYSQEKVAGRNLTPFQRAIFRYAGKYNYPKYLAKVEQFRKQLGSAEMRIRAETEFNLGSAKLTINGKPGSYKDYQEAQRASLENWGLSEYSSLGPPGKKFATK